MPNPARPPAADLADYAGWLDATDDAIVAFDAGWHVTAWNAGAERMYGWRPEEVLGRHVTEVAHLEIGDEERAAIRRTAAEQGRWRGEVVAHRKDGGRVWVEALTVAIGGDGDGPAGFLGIHRDVTERRLAERALHAAHERTATILESITDAFVAVDRQWRFTYVNDRALRRMQAHPGHPGLTRDDVLGRGMWDMFPDAVGTELERAYRRAMRDGVEVGLESHFAPSGEWIEAHAYPSADGLSIYYRDVTERKEAEAMREREVRRHALVAHLGLRALSTESVQCLMDDAVALTARMLGSELGAVVEHLPDGERFRLRAGVGWDAGVVGRAAADPFASYTVGSGDPVVCGDVAADPRVSRSELLARHGVASAATVVITGRHRPFGALGFFSRRPRAFSEADVDFLQAVANVLATAVEHSHAATLLAHARESERRRIARDLHDDALHGLTAALIEAGRLRARSLTPAASDELVALLRGVGRQLRAAIYDLRLDGEEGRPFAERLRRLVEIQRTMTASCDIELVMDDELPTGGLGAGATEVLRIVAEGLTNARLHAGVGHIRVSAAGVPACLRLQVADGGRGFDPAAPSRTGSGIDAMRERADLLGARLEIRSAPGAGTTVGLEVPLA